MRHLIIYLFFIIVTLGCSIITILSLQYIRLKQKIIKFILFFYFFYSIEIALFLLGNYIDLNIHNLFISILGFILILEQLSRYFTQIAFVICINFLTEVKESKLINLVSSIIISLGFIYNLFFLATDINNFAILNLQHIDITDIIVVTVYFYAIFLLFFRFRYIKNKENQKLAKKLLAFLIIFLPIHFIDNFDFFDLPFPLTLIIYAALSIILVVHFLKNPGVLGAEITQLDHSQLKSKYNLSERECEIISFVQKGLSNKKIAETTFISIGTVKTHLHNIYTKTGTTNRYELTHFIKNLSKD